MKVETELQRKIVRFMLENAPVEPNAQIYFFAADPDGEKRYYCGAARVRAQSEQFSLVFTMASHGRPRIFLTITDGDPQLVASLLAKLERFHAVSQRLDLGHTLKLQDPRLSERGLVGAVLLRPRTSTALREFPDEIVVDDAPIPLSLVAFLTAREHQRKLEQGFDALLDLFEAEGKDLVRFGATSL